MQGGKQFDVLNGMDGETILCSPDGEQCRTLHCFSASHDTGRNVTKYTRFYHIL